MALADYFILQRHKGKHYERIRLKKAEINICFLFGSKSSEMLSSQLFITVCCVICMMFVTVIQALV